MRRAWLFALVACGPSALVACGPSARPAARAPARQPPLDARRAFAHFEAVQLLDAWQAWSEAHGDADCPASIDALLPYVDGPEALVDPWGARFAVVCDRARTGVDVAIVSAGPDQALGTDDDIDSAHALAR